jgi:uncharacterized SAM-dependent methyltransferase
MNTNLPKVFIGSSAEQLKTAECLQVNLGDRSLAPTNWTQGNTFGYNDAPLDSLLSVVNESDFACFFIEPDDIAISRGETKNILRDNVIFELGLFLGKLGKKRVFIIKNRNTEKLDLPSDLEGLVFLDYASNDNNDTKSIKSALNNVSIEIRHTIDELGIFNKTNIQPIKENSDTPNRRIEDPLERGGTNHISNIADAAIFIAEEKYKYKAIIKKNIIDGKTLAPKFLYYTEESCQHWLDLCNNPLYKFYANSIALLSNSINDIVDIIDKNSQNTEFDFVSLGVGNGKKDNIILKALEKKLLENEQTYYYPIDISDPMIVEAIRNSIKDVNKDKIKIKAIIADFVNLETLKTIYEERPSGNIFSILGNTLGNNYESEIFKSLQDSMYAGDFLLVEVNVDQEGIKNESFLRDDLNILHDFSPLSSLGVSLKKNNMKYITKQNNKLLSMVDDTVTVIASYKNAKIDNKDIKNIKLSMINHYKLNSLAETIEKTLALNILYKEEKDGVGIVLAQKP